MPFVKADGVVVDRIHDNQSSGGDLPGGDCLAERFGEKPSSEAATLFRPIHRQSGEENHPDRVARQAAHKLGRSLRPKHRTHCEAEVTEDPAPFGEQEGSGGVHLLRSQGVAGQPAIEVGVAGFKRSDVVLVIEPFEAQWFAAHSDSGGF